MWSQRIIRDHEEAGKRLTSIVHDAFKYLGLNPRTTEGEVKDFILKQFKVQDMVMDQPFKTPIVAFGSHAAEPHYYPVPGTRRLTPGTLVLIDIWGRLKGRSKPYADITWMGFFGAKVPRESQRVYDAVTAARDACLELVRHGARQGRLPIGKVADEKARSVIRKWGYGRFILHSTGHALGFASPHGRYGRNLNRKNQYPLLKNVGYTIEPGIYMKGKLGVRSEMNFYVNGMGKVVITTPMQRKLVRIGNT